MNTAILGSIINFSYAKKETVKNRAKPCKSVSGKVKLKGTQINTDEHGYPQINIQF